MLKVPDKSQNILEKILKNSVIITFDANLLLRRSKSGARIFVLGALFERLEFIQQKNVQSVYRR